MQEEPATWIAGWGFQTRIELQEHTQGVQRPGEPGTAGGEKVRCLGARERLCFHHEIEEKLAETWAEEGQDLSKAGSLSHDFCTRMSWAPKPVFSWIKLRAWEASWEIPFQWKYWFMKVYSVQCNKSHKALQLSLNKSLPGNSSWGENLIKQCFSRVFSIIIFSFCVFMLIIVFFKLAWTCHCKSCVTIMIEHSPMLRNFGLSSPFKNYK